MTFDTNASGREAVFFELADPAHPSDSVDDAPRNRCTGDEFDKRVQTALHQLESGSRPRSVARSLKDRYNVSLKQARRYVNIALLDLHEPITNNSLTQRIQNKLDHIEELSEAALQAGDTKTAMAAIKLETKIVLDQQKLNQRADQFAQRINLNYGK